MAQKRWQICLLYIITTSFLLFYQVSAAQQFAKVDQWMKEHVKDLGGRSVLLIYKDGKIVYSHAENEVSSRQKAGARLLARRTGQSANQLLSDLSDDKKIAIASCSKWLSAALVMTYVDEGKLTLQDSIGKFLPEMTENGKGSITIAQCLSHTTGISSEGFAENKELFKNAATMDDVVSNIAKKPIEGAPGSVFHYSSIGLQLAAAVIEKISGKDFETNFIERIAKPCEMIQTDFGHKRVPLAAGGAYSTANDYLNFLKMILSKGQFGGKQVLTAHSVALMQTNQIASVAVRKGPAEAGNWGYGLGEWTMQESIAARPSAAVSSPGLFGSFPWIDNEKKYAAVLFTFNLKNKGRRELYKGLKTLIDTALVD